MVIAKSYFQKVPNDRLRAPELLESIQEKWRRFDWETLYSVINLNSLLCRILVNQSSFTKTFTTGSYLCHEFKISHLITTVEILKEDELKQAETQRHATYTDGPRAR